MAQMKFFSKRNFGLNHPAFLFCFGDPDLPRIGDQSTVANLETVHIRCRGYFDCSLKMSLFKFFQRSLAESPPKSQTAMRIRQNSSKESPIHRMGNFLLPRCGRRSGALNSGRVCSILSILHRGAGRQFRLGDPIAVNLNRTSL